jgi:hypothetical protein
MIDLGSFLASHNSKIFLAMRGTAAPLTEGGTSPFWQPPDLSFGGGSAPKKWSLFFSKHFSNKNKCWGLNKAFFSPFETRKRR